MSAERGSHYYKKYWDPVESECLDCAHEKENPYDYFAIKTCQKDGKIVVQLPIEISQPTKYLLDRGARITATLTSMSYSASPLVQGGLEIPCLIKVYMPRTVKKKTKKQIISMYEEMIEALYQEKDGRPVIGSILNCSETTEPADIERRGTKRTRNQTASLKLKTAKPREDETGNTMNLGKDIRTFFKPTASKSKKRKTSLDTESVIILD